jgi:hypothetical protein
MRGDTQSSTRSNYLMLVPVLLGICTGSVSFALKIPHETHLAQAADNVYACHQC